MSALRPIYQPPPPSEPRVLRLVQDVIGCGALLFLAVYGAHFVYAVFFWRG